MKRFTLYILFGLALATCAQAQWITKNYTLKSGWNSIWLAGDASHTTIDKIVTDPAITEVWRWNPNPNQVQFSQDPSAPTINSDIWTIWQRVSTGEKKLTRLIANTAYLVRTTADVTLSIKQLVRPPSATWLLSGANFLGFPAGGSVSSGTTPLFSTYFASFINAGVSGLPTTSSVYKYIGGPLGSINPAKLTNLGIEKIDPDKAYWFSFAGVNSFTGALEYEVPSNDGLAYGRSGSSITVGVTNRSTVDRTINLFLNSSEQPPASTNANFYATAVPLQLRQFNGSTNSYGLTSVPTSAGALAVTVPASGRINLEFRLDRSAMRTAGAEGCASILRLQDTQGLTDVRMPVSALPDSAAGLWLCEASLTDVGSNGAVSTSSGTATARAFPLQFYLHLDASGNARLLRQAYRGQLVTTGNPQGVAISESRILPFATSTIPPARYYSPSLPYGGEIPSATGASFNEGSAVTWKITHDYADPVNPFVHTYHPDHDNLDAKFMSLPAGKESYTVVRNVTLTFARPQTSASTLIGSYTETITGIIKKNPLNNGLAVSGTFVLRRISELSNIDLTSP
jgi:hypothetical protein